MPATYTLPPALTAKAIALDHALVDLHFARELWPIVLLILLLELHVPARMSAVAARITPRRWLQVTLFAALFFLLLSLLELPGAIAVHHIVLRFGLSIQSWASWFADVAKFLTFETLGSIMLIPIIYLILRYAPRPWWFWAWLIAVVLVVVGIYLTPVYLDPLFNKFEPLSQTDPALVTQLEQVVARSGVSIPPDRIFLMRASAKTTETNAYVTGFGASKRIVVWDTTLKSTPPDEISFLFAHEMGHYVLRHVPLGVGFAAVLMFLCFWFGARVVDWLLARFGTRWRITSLQDPAAIAVLLLVLSVAQVLTEPIGNAFSRHIEHAADVYGLQTIQGIVPDPGATAARGFQRLGEQNLDTPERRPFVEFWLYSHPAIADRIAFAAAYGHEDDGAHPK